MENKNIEKFSRFQSQTKNLRRGGIYFGIVAVLALGAASCGDEEKWETVTENQFSKGVRTTIEENEQGKFEITDEEVVSDTSQSAFVVKYRDGRMDVLSLAQARTLLSGAPADTSVAKASVAPSGGSSLSNILWWGAGGYLLGRALHTPTVNGFYNQRRFQPPPQMGGSYGGGRRDSMGRSSSSRGRVSTGSSYRSSSSAADQLRSTSTTRTFSRSVPTGRSGFFGRSSGRSSGG